MDQSNNNSIPFPFNKSPYYISQCSNSWYLPTLVWVKNTHSYHSFLEFLFTYWLLFFPLFTLPKKINICWISRFYFIGSHWCKVSFFVLSFCHYKSSISYNNLIHSQIVIFSFCVNGFQINIFWSISPIWTLVNSSLICMQQYSNQLSQYLVINKYIKSNGHYLYFTLICFYIFLFP